MNECKRFERCSAAVCPLELGPEIHAQGDSVCHWIKKYLEGGDCPVKDAVAATEPVWREKIGNSQLSKHVRAGQRLLKIKEVSERLEIKKATLRCWCSRKTIPYVKIGGAVRFDPGELDRWLNERSVKTSDFDGLPGPG